VIFDVAGTGVAAEDISARLKARGVLINPVSGTLMRFVTHLDVNRAGCERAAEVMAAVV
jgi:threonine aldolase